MLSLTDDLRPIREDSAPGYSFVPELNVFVHDMFAVLVKEIRVELADPTYKKYRHGRCSTNNRGCSGPMCRWARRVWQANNAAVRAKVENRKYKPRPSLERQLTNQLCERFDEYLEREWLGRTVTKEVEKALAGETPATEPTPQVRSQGSSVSPAFMMAVLI